MTLGMATTASGEWQSISEKTASYEFRVLGTIEASCRLGAAGESSWTTLRTKDEAHARMVASKWLRDVSGFGFVRPTEGSAVSLSLAGVGEWIIGLDGADVQILFAKDRGTLEALAERAGAKSWKTVQEREYPRFLDRFDNDAVSFGFMGWSQNRTDKDINESAAWIGSRKFGIVGEIGSKFHPKVAPGVFDDSYVDYYEAIARRYDVPFQAYTSGYSPLRPEYLWNVAPLPYYHAPGDLKNLSTSTKSQRMLPSISLLCGSGVDPAAERADSEFAAILAGKDHLASMQGTMEFGSSFPLVLFGISETPEVKRDWVTFLRGVRGYSLQDVGKAYRGNPDVYGSWEDVPVTSILDFTGWNAGESLDLRGDWRGRPDFRKEGLGQNRFVNDIPSAGWASLQHGDTIGGYKISDVSDIVTGNKYAYLQWSEVPVEKMAEFTGWDIETCKELRDFHDKAKYRASSTWADGADSGQTLWTPVRQDDLRILSYSAADVWLKREVTLEAEQVARLRYLHISRNAFHEKGRRPEVYVNGKVVPEMNSGSDSMGGNYDLCYDLKGLLGSGKNRITLRVVGGQPINYIFLGSQGLWKYPSGNPRMNRMYFDLVEFSAWIAARNAEALLRSKRAGDPQGHPMIVMAGLHLQDYLSPLESRYGANAHCTGQSGDCWAPWVLQYSATNGEPITAEVGSAPKSAAQIRKMVTLYSLLGVDALHFLFHPTQYRDVHEVGEWIDTNLPLLHSVGKLERPAGSFAVLRSVRDASRLGFKGPWQWDISRGEAQAVGRSVDLVDPVDLAAGGKSGRFKVLFDAGTELMTREEIQGLEKYVCDGGIFVALHNTGRHSPDYRDSWPISGLLGLRAVSDTVGRGKLRFSSSQTLWPSLRGKEIEASGVAFQVISEETTAPASMEIVAEWVGRSTAEGNVAIAVRRLGQGRIVTLGSPFWRKAEDRGGSWKPDSMHRRYLAELLDSLGVPSVSVRDLNDALNLDVFAQHFFSKNGLYDAYLLAQMNENAARGEVAITYTATGKPTWLKEISNQETGNVPFEMEDAGFRISGITLDPMQLRIYVAPRADIAESTLFWLGSLQRRWKALEPVPTFATLDSERKDHFVMALQNDWSMSVGGEQEVGGTPPDAALWQDSRTVKIGTFASLGLPEDAMVRFRKEVPIPKEWAGRRIVLRFAGDWVIGGIHYGHRLWINGKAAAPGGELGSASRFSQELSDVQPGSTLTLVLEVDGRLPKGENRTHPSGVAGVFFLEALPQSVKVTPLENWSASDGTTLKVSPVKASGAAQYAYYSTEFELPAEWPAERVFLESKHHLGWFILNDQMIAAPGWMNQIDITRMVRKHGSKNVLYWVPDQFEPTEIFCRRYLLEPPSASLAWQREDPR